jgi:hypothetical protein
MKQAIKKKDIKAKPSILDIKSKLGLNIKGEQDLVKSNADKPTDFIPLPSAFAEAIKLPGIPMGYLSIVTGWSNTGKSTIKNCLIASCINNGILPVIYETENNFDFQYAIDCGVKATPIYGDVEVEDIDEESGEITYHTENRIVNYEGNFLFFDTKILAEQYGDNDYSSGKKTKTKRKVAVLEDIAYSMNDILDMQDNGDIQQPICFIWDSIGSIGSYKSYASKNGNNMFDAGAISQAFNQIINDRIPSSKKVSEPYTNTFFCVNKIWNDSMNSMGGVPSIELKGGKTMFYGARLIIHLGGIGKAATKKLDAVAKGQKYQYGIVTKIRTTKNQLPTPWNITYEGEMACVHNGLLNPSDLDTYKKTYVGDILKRLESLGGNEVDASDVSFEEEDSDD